MLCGNCAEAQALRMAFPEFSGGQVTAEEMEGKTFGDGPVIEGEVVEHRRAAAAATPRPERVYEADPDEQPADGLSADDRAWVARQQGYFDRAQNAEQVRKVEQMPSFQGALQNAPKAVVEMLRAMAARAYLRVQPKEPAKVDEPVAPEEATQETAQTVREPAMARAAMAGADVSPWDDEVPITLGSRGK
jgi:hypothetical protein